MSLKGFIFAAGKQSNADLPFNQVAGFGPALLEVPRIRFSLAVMSKAGIKQVMIGASPKCVAALHARFGSGTCVGVDLSYLLLEPDSSIEHALYCAGRYFANSDVLLATPGVCCINFDLARIGFRSGNTISSFRMHNSVNGVRETRPNLLLLGRGVLIRLKRHEQRSIRESTEVDQLRRALMTRFKFADIDLRDQCMFANLKSGISIDPSNLSEAAVLELLNVDIKARV